MTISSQSADHLQNRAAAIIENNPEAFWSLDREWRFTYLNSSAEALLGRSRDELLGCPVWDAFPEVVGTDIERRLRETAATQVPQQFDTYFGAPRHMWYAVHAFPTADGLCGSLHECAERVAQAEEIARINRLYAVITNVNQAIAHVKTREQLCKEVCEAMVEEGGLRMVWLGWLDPETNQITPLAQHGDVGGYLATIRVRADDKPEGSGPMGQAIRTGQAYVCNDFFSDPATIPWREAAAAQGFESVAVLPIRLHGEICGAFAVYADSPGVFRDREMEMLTEAANDISFALGNLALEDQRIKAEESVRESEQFALATLNALSAEIAILGADGTILEANDAWRDFIKRNSGGQDSLFAGANYLHICQHTIGRETEEARQAAAGIRAVAAGESPLFTLEYLSHAGETRRWFSLRATPIPGEGLARVVVSHEDITARKQADENLRESQNLLQIALSEAEERADRDPLTGLFNHRSFHKHYEQETARARRDGTTLAVIVLDLDNFKFFNDVYGHATGDEVLRMVSARLLATCRPYDILARFGGDEFAVLLPNVGATPAVEIERRLKDGLDDLVYLVEGQQSAIPLSISLGAALFPADGADRHEVLHLADQRMSWLKTGGVIEEEAVRVRDAARSHFSGFSMLDALVTAVDNKDRYTRRHSEDVMSYSVAIAEELGLDSEARDTIAIAALIHDLGKIGVPDAILRKPGVLTEADLEAIKMHPQIGAIMVTAVPGLEGTLDAVRHHHERWDGLGYPSGLVGEATPLFARLMAVADAFSAMTTDRPYRKGMSWSEALAILMSGAGYQWDPACVEAFVRVQEKKPPRLANKTLPAQISLW